MNNDKLTVPPSRPQGSLPFRKYLKNSGNAKSLRYEVENFP